MFFFSFSFTRPKNPNQTGKKISTDPLTLSLFTIEPIFFGNGSEWAVNINTQRKRIPDIFPQKKREAEKGFFCFVLNLNLRILSYLDV